MKQKLLAGFLLLTVCVGMLCAAFATEPDALPTAWPRTEDEILAWQAKIDEMEREMGPRVTWSLEDKARMFEGYGLPTADEITEEEAVRLAKEALQKQYGVSGEVLATFTAYSFFVVSDPGLRFYAISFFTDPTGRGNIPYSVEISSDGTILHIYTTSNG